MQDKIGNLIAEELKNLGITNYGLVRRDGSFFDTSLSESAQQIISKIVVNNESIPVNSYIKRKLVRKDNFIYIYKVCYNGFLICISSLDSGMILNELKQITDKFGFQLFSYFKTIRKVQKVQEISKYPVMEPISAVILSKNKDYMPEPIAWIPSSLSEVDALRIANKALLLILGDTDEIKECYSLIHFMKIKRLGLIYLFEIPNRTKSSSATLTILFDESIKKKILKKIEDLENQIKTFLDENKQNFNFSNEKLKVLHDEIISIFNRPDKGVEAISTRRNSEHVLKETMIKEIKKIGSPEKTEKITNKSTLKSEMVKAVKEVKNQA